MSFVKQIPRILSAGSRDIPKPSNFISQTIFDNLRYWAGIYEQVLNVKKRFYVYECLDYLLEEFRKLMRAYLPILNDVNGVT